MHFPYTQNISVLTNFSFCLNSSPLQTLPSDTHSLINFNQLHPKRNASYISAHRQPQPKRMQNHLSEACPCPMFSHGERARVGCPANPTRSFVASSPTKQRKRDRTVNETRVVTAPVKWWVHPATLARAASVGAESERVRLNKRRSLASINGEGPLWRTGDDHAS